MKFSGFLTYAVMVVAVGLALAGCAGSTLSSHPKVAQGQSRSARPVIIPPRAANAQPARPLPPTVAANTPRRAALLLPLSGPQAELGQSMRDAAMLATQDLAPGTFELSVHDTNAGAENAYQSARAAGAQLIIGPLFSADVTAVRQSAAGSVPVLALSNDTSLAGPNLFVMGFWPGAQIARVVNYAQARGLKNLVALVPNDAYGQAVAAAVQATIRPPARIVSIIPSDDPASAMQQLAALRGQYDMLLLPEGGAKLATLLDTLAPADLLQRAPGQPVQLLGSGLWDAPDMQQRPMLFGAWYAAPDPNSRASFMTRYQRSFGAAPVRIASLAYDATAMAAVLASRGWAYDANTLTQPQGFDGVDGLFRVQTNGLVDRSLAVLQVTPSNVQVIDAAPKTF